MRHGASMFHSSNLQQRKMTLACHLNLSVTVNCMWQISIICFIENVFAKNPTKNETLKLTSDLTIFAVFSHLVFSS